MCMIQNIWHQSLEVKLLLEWYWNLVFSKRQEETTLAFAAICVLSCRSQSLREFTLGLSVFLIWYHTYNLWVSIGSFCQYKTIWDLLHFLRVSIIVSPLFMLFPQQPDDLASGNSAASAVWLPKCSLHITWRGPAIDFTVKWVWRGMKGAWLESDWLVDFSGLQSNALFEHANRVASKRRQKDLSNRTERCATIQTVI